MFRQQIIRDKDYNIIETIDGDTHIKYNNGDIIYYKSDNFEYPSFKTINSPQEEEFINIVKDGLIIIDKIGYLNPIFLVKNDKCLFEYDLENGYLYLNHQLLWSVFENKYSMNDQQIEEFLKDMVEKHFNCKEVTPLMTEFTRVAWWKNISINKKK